MKALTGPNGVVVRLPDTVAMSLVGDGSRGYTLVSDEAATPAPLKAAPKKRAPRKPAAKPAE